MSALDTPEFAMTPPAAPPARAPWSRIALAWLPHWGPTRPMSPGRCAPTPWAG